MNFVNEYVFRQASELIEKIERIQAEESLFLIDQLVYDLARAVILLYQIERITPIPIEEILEYTDEEITKIDNLREGITHSVSLLHFYYFINEVI